MSDLEKLFLTDDVDTKAEDDVIRLLTDDYEPVPRDPKNPPPFGLQYE